MIPSYSTFALQLPSSAHFHLNIKSSSFNVLWFTNRLQASNSNVQFHFKAEAFFIKKTGANNEMTLLVLATCNEHGNLRLSLYDMAQPFFYFPSNKFPNALCMSSSFALQESSFSCYFFILVEQQRNLHHLRWCCAVGDANMTKKNPQPRDEFLKMFRAFRSYFFSSIVDEARLRRRRNPRVITKEKPYKHQILM